MNILCRLFGHDESQFWVPIDNCGFCCVEVRRCWRCCAIVAEREYVRRPPPMKPGYFGVRGEPPTVQPR